MPSSPAPMSPTLSPNTPLPMPPTQSGYTDEDYEGCGIFDPNIKNDDICKQYCPYWYCNSSN